MSATLLCLWWLGAPLAGAPPATQGPIESATVHYPAGAPPSLQIRLRDGSEIAWPGQDRDFGGKLGRLPQIGFSNVFKFRHGGALGWLAGYHVCRSDPSCTPVFVLWRDGKIAWTAAPPNGAISNWGVVDGEVGLVISERDRPDTEFYQLRRYEDGAVLKQYDSARNKPPAWVTARPSVAEQEAKSPLPRIVKVTDQTPAPAKGVAQQNQGPPGPLRLDYSNGSTVNIPSTCCTLVMDGDRKPLAQFEEVAISPQGQGVGFLSSYWVCAQSYPCTAQFTWWQNGHVAWAATPRYGIFTGWDFIDHGRQIRIQNEFPHGNELYITMLYDTRTGRLLASYNPRKGLPDWVDRLLHPTQAWE